MQTELPAVAVNQAESSLDQSRWTQKHSVGLFLPAFSLTLHKKNPLLAPFDAAAAWQIAKAETRWLSQKHLNTVFIVPVWATVKIFLKTEHTGRSHMPAASPLLEHYVSTTESQILLILSLHANLHRLHWHYTRPLKNAVLFIPHWAIWNEYT